MSNKAKGNSRNMSTKTGARIVYRSLSQLRKWTENYRVGDLDSIIASIVRFGFNDVLIVWHDNEVMAGNHRLLALQTIKANGGDPPLGVVVEQGEWIVPCIEITHLNRSEARAFAVAHNRTAERGKSDPEALAALLAQIAGDGDLFKATGYNELDLTKLLSEINDANFQPVPNNDSGSISKPEPEIPTCKCPECGHEFRPEA